jgi:hypothetical protein
MFDRKNHQCCENAFFLRRLSRPLVSFNQNIAVRPKGALECDSEALPVISIVTLQTNGVTRLDIVRGFCARTVLHHIPTWNSGSGVHTSALGAGGAAGTIAWGEAPQRATPGIRGAQSHKPRRGVRFEKMVAQNQNKLLSRSMKIELNLMRGIYGRESAAPPGACLTGILRSRGCAPRCGASPRAIAPSAPPAPAFPWLLPREKCINSIGASGAQYKCGTSKSPASARGRNVDAMRPERPAHLLYYS